MYFFKERVKPCLFVTFNIIISHIFIENFTETPQVLQKILRISVTILAIFYQYSTIFFVTFYIS